MRRCTICLLGLVLLAAAPAARAEEPAACLIQGNGDPGEEYGRMGFQAQPVAQEIEAWLGEQFGGFWLQPRDGNWYLGLAPGQVTPDELRQRALELVDARYDGEDEQRLRERLRISEQPYGAPELRRIQDELAAQAAARRWGVAWTAGVGCRHSGAWRVEFELYSDATEEIVAEARSLAAPHGDKVRVVHLRDVPPPMLTAQARPAAPRIAQLVRVRGCRLALRQSARRSVASAHARSRGRRVRLRARPVRLRAGTARVVVRLKDGRTVRGTVRLRSCASS